MPDTLAELARRLEIDRLIEEKLQGLDELILIPHLFLHQIPFAALPISGGSPLAPLKKGGTGTGTGTRTEVPLFKGDLGGSNPGGSPLAGTGTRTEVPLKKLILTHIFLNNFKSLSSLGFAEFIHKTSSFCGGAFAASNRTQGHQALFVRSHR